MNRQEPTTKQLRSKKIIEIKKKAFINYIHIMSGIILLYTIIYFLLNEIIFSIYLLLGCIVLQLFLNYNKNINSLDNKIRMYFFIAPLFDMIFILQFWEYSVVSFIWLIPIPLGAYIFLKKNDVLLYSLYSIFIAISIIIIANTIEFHFKKYPYSLVRFSDLFIITINFSIVFYLLHFKGKIKELEFLSEIEDKEKISLPVSIYDKEIIQIKTLFEKIESVMENEKPYKNPKFNISLLSTIVNVNNNYISKSIRYHGFTNFNYYTNSYRIKYIIELMNNVNLEKVTLLYIYTEAGFTSQTTFNRAFKELKGVTPSEYMRDKENFNFE